MRITNIGLYSNNFQVANFNFRDPETINPYVIQGIFGLDADEIVPKFYGFSTTSKIRQYDMTLPKREITIRIALIPQPGTGKTYSDLRDDLYRAISSSRSGLIELKFNNRSATIATTTGFITKFEAALSTKQPEVQITIKCVDAMLKGPSAVEVDTVLIGNSFTIVDNISTAPHGMTMQLAFTADTTDIVIKDVTTPEWSFTITPGDVAGGTGFKSGDVLTLSSESNAKELYITRSSVDYYLVDKILSGSTWPCIFPGANNFEIVTGTFTWNFIKYWQTFWGI
jgi:hypothetical protein